MGNRINRIAEEIKREISSIIRYDMKDPRLPEIVSIVHVKVSGDLKYAKVYVSVLGTEKQKENAMKALKSASGFVRREIGHRIKLRYTPEIMFQLDSSIEEGVYMNKLIKETIKKDKE